jgi:hypothetical protein
LVRLAAAAAAAACGGGTAERGVRLSSILVKSQLGAACQVRRQCLAADHTRGVAALQQCSAAAERAGAADACSAAPQWRYLIGGVHRRRSIRFRSTAIIASLRFRAYSEFGGQYVDVQAGH